MGKKKKKKIVELEEINVIVKVPKDAASVTINAVIIGKDEKTMKVKKHLTPDDIRTARKDFLDNVEDGDDYDAMYVITDETRAYLNNLGKELQS